MKQPITTSIRFAAIRSTPALARWVAPAVLFALTVASHAADSRTIRLSFDIQNTRSQLIPSAEFWTYAPRAATPDAAATVQANYPYTELSDDLGNRILHFTFSNIPPYASKTLALQFDLPLQGTALPSDPPVERFLLPDPLVEMGDTEFIKAAPTFMETGNRATAQRIQDWIVSNIKPDAYSPRDLGALHALTTRKGDCTEMALLFVALCRMHGVPARAVSGYVCDRNRIVTASDYHDWAEFYDGKAWQIADPNRQVFSSLAVGYVPMRISGATNSPLQSFPRFRFEGQDLAVKMN